MRQTSELKSACREQLTNGASGHNAVAAGGAAWKEQSARFPSLPPTPPLVLAWPTHVCVSVAAAAETQLAHKTKFQNNLRLAIFEDALRNFIEMFGTFSCRAQFVSHTHTNTHTSADEADYTACNFDFCIAYFLGHVKQTFRLL